MSCWGESHSGVTYSPATSYLLADECVAVFFSHNVPPPRLSIPALVLRQVNVTPFFWAHTFSRIMTETSKLTKWVLLRDCVTVLAGERSEPRGKMGGHQSQWTPTNKMYVNLWIPHPACFQRAFCCGQKSKGLFFHASECQAEWPTLALGIMFHSSVFSLEAASQFNDPQLFSWKENKKQ